MGKIAKLSWLLGVSSVVLIPCFWLPIVSTGDLQSHLYNAWLSDLIERGLAPGLWIEHRITNALIDRILAWLVPAIGVGAAERLTTSGAVLIFFWGTFAYLSASFRERADWQIPWLAMLAYGFVFQLGLLNCYISTGLVFWAMAILRPGLTARRALVASPLLATAALAHPIPVAWFVGTSAYRALAVRLHPRRQALLFLASITSLYLLRRYITTHFVYQWSLRQLGMVLGVDQVLLYGWRYAIVACSIALYLALLCVKLPNRWYIAASVPLKCMDLLRRQSSSSRQPYGLPSRSRGRA